MLSTKFDKKALAEVYEVLIMLDKKDLTKIPKRLVETIKLNKDNEYKVDFQDIEDGKILPDTIKILSTLYTYGKYQNCSFSLLYNTRSFNILILLLS